MLCEICQKKVENPSLNWMDDAPVSLSLIMAMLQNIYGVRLKDLRTNRRNFHAIQYRTLFCKLACEFSNASYPQIGRYIKRDHTTVIYLVKKELHESFELKRAEVSQKLTAIREKLGEIA